MTRSCTRLSLGMFNIKSQISIQRSSRWAINCTKPAPLQKPTKQPFQRNFVWSLMKSCLLETMLNKIFNTPPPSFMIFCWTRSSRDEYRTIPHICPTHHRGCLCKKFLSGVNLSRMSEEKMHIYDFFRNIFSVFGDFSRFLGVKFGFRKSCLCKRNDKYEVWNNPPCFNPDLCAC